MSNAKTSTDFLSDTRGKFTTTGSERWKVINTARPTPLGNSNSILTAFDGNLSKLPLPVEHWIQGAGTLGTPTTGYLYTPETAAMYIYSYNESGFNNSTSGNVGRTGAVATRVAVYQAGQGDHFAFNASCFGNSTKSGSTKFLANPAIGIINGDLTAGVDGLYLNPLEFVLQDGGFDAAGIGAVLRLNRTNATGAKSVIWTGMRVQSEGSASVDNLVSATGKFLVGLDLSMSNMDLGANAAAISLKSGQRIYFNNAATASGALDADWRTTVFNGDYIQHTTSGFTGLNVVQAGSSRLQIGSTVTVNTSLQVAIASVNNYANDAAAAAGGVPIGGVYRNGSVLQIRVT
jgi:hypothetical protein